MPNISIKNFINDFYKNSLEIKKVKTAVQQSKELTVCGLTTPAKIFAAANFINAFNQNILLLAPDMHSALRYYNDLQDLTDKEVLYLPIQEASPYEQVFSDAYILKQQISILESFSNSDNKVIITTSKALLNVYLSKKTIHNSTVTLSIKKEYDPQELAIELISLGYNRTSLVTEPGEFSLRGDILDIFPISDNPVRVEFFAEEVEKIKVFDIDTQRSTKNITEVRIEPRYKVIINNDAKNIILDKLNTIKDNSDRNLSDEAVETLRLTIEHNITRLNEENYFDGIEYFAPFVNETFDDIFDYLPSNTLIISHESIECIHKLEVADEKFLKEYEQNINEGLAVPLPQMLHRNAKSIIEKAKQFKQLNLDSFFNDEDSITTNIESEIVPKFLAKLDDAIAYIQKQRACGNNVFIITEYPQRLEEILKQYECPYIFINEDSVCDYTVEDLINNKDIIITKTGLSEGFTIPSLNIVTITDIELFNKRFKKPTITKKLSKKENIDFLVSVNDLQVGDYIVHAKHGIGKFVGFSKQNIDGQFKDYLTIEYANSDRLHMPAEQINFLSKYRGAGSAATSPKLSKMGGADWESVKNKVKKSVLDIAKDLINLYAKRSKAEGFIFENDSPWQLEMEEAFPYTETPDQMQAIIDTKSDMESNKPMDRLICGDVGFGKTEVAIRGIFKAILSGKQVAMMAPTTILAQQHYLNMLERFSPYSLRIELLSRFRSAKEQKETIKKLALGECDLVIGTHRLLQKDINFKNLGLLVIDEEHRFGVTHKEKLKQLRSEIDVLTLSATPIPRTLYMSLSGVRDMSLITTPPVNRAPIKTYVGEYNQALIKTAIYHEIEREGQIYFVHNRVQSIYKVADDLQKLMPDARIAIGHGQMHEKDLEKVMYEFSNHEYDILVCTTIIESGLDIPNANTIIIDNADRFGLAQLYQMRGRVGRSESQAYAYCFYTKDKNLTDEAKDRLRAIKDFTTLGSGYHIALRDLEIRGVGNILGAQQHGHMVSVGFDLYCSLLDEAIQELQGEKKIKKEPTVVDINITAFIPDEWVGDKDQKMIEYKRLADVQSLRELELIEEEWEDRFGILPLEVKRLIKIIKIRLLATDIGIILVRETDSGIRISTNYEFAEWLYCKKQLPDKLTKLIKWIKAPITSTNGKSILLLNSYGLLEEEELKILEELFSSILKIIN